MQEMTERNHSCRATTERFFKPITRHPRFVKRSRRAKVGREQRSGTEFETQRSLRLIQKPPQLILCQSVQQKFVIDCTFQQEIDRSHSHHQGDGDRKEDDSPRLRHFSHSLQLDANGSANASVKRGESGSVTTLTFSDLHTHCFVGGCFVGLQTQWHRQNGATESATTELRASLRMTQWRGKCQFSFSVSA